MPRYIDADDLAKVFMLKGKDKLRLATVINEIEMLPTADVVEVVRCKDCEHSTHWYADKIQCMFWSEIPLICFNDDFCSRGKRKEQP